jgi:DNA polymerase-3 subunit epsilon
VYVRCRLDIPYPVLEVAPEPAPGHAVNVGPVRGRTAAAELVDQLNSLFGLRQCGRGLKLREHPSVYGQMGRCLSPCLNDLDPNLYRARLDEALAPFSQPGASGDLLLEMLEQRLREAVEARRYERAAVLHRRRERMAFLVERLGGLLQATHAQTRLVLARHPVKESWDALWIVAGRVADWGPLPEPEELARRTEAALETRPGGSRRPAIPPEEVDEIRIVQSWIASHDPPQLELGPDTSPDLVSGWVEAAVTSAAVAV